MEIIKEFLHLAFDHLGWIFSIIFIIIQRESIGNLISRLTNFSYKKDDLRKEITLNAHVSVLEDEEKKDLISKNIKDEILEEDKKEEETDFKVIIHAFRDSVSIEEIKKKFEEYSIKEENKDLLTRHHNIFLYFLFKERQDLSAITILTTLTETYDTDENKYNAYEWLTLCYKNLSDINMEIKLWEKAVKSFANQHLKTKAIVELSSALGRDNKSIEAKQLLINRLEEVSTKEDKFELYQGLSIIEKLLGNGELATFCQDKSLEYNVGNEDKLFDAAYIASQEKLSGISIVNYNQLLRLNNKHAMALNNIGVEAAEIKLKSKAVENYNKSSKQNNTLAMSNKANLLLDSGFIEEAKEIAKNAQTFENPHKNIYSLLSRIDQLKEDEDKSWGEIIEKAEEYQKNIRKYTSSYYCKSLNTFSGKWNLQDDQIIEFSLHEQKYEVFWEIKDYKYQIIGEIINSSFKGIYKIISTCERSSTSLLILPMDENIECLGYLSDDGKKILFFAKEYRKKLDLVLLKI